MSHVRPKENLELKRQTMDLSDTREHLVSTLKMAYKKINSLNAATRKINAVMAILFMKRDKAKTDVESVARRLTAKIVLLQSTFEKEIAEIVDKKVKAMEEQNQFVFDQICTLGEACVEAEKVLKIQNEDKLAKDGGCLSEKFHSLLMNAPDGEEISDLEDSMFLQFVPGDLESKFGNGTFGQIYSSNKDSGISFSCANTSCDLGPDVSPVSQGDNGSGLTVSDCGQDDICKSQILQQSVFTEPSKLVRDSSDCVPCPPGFESGRSKNSTPVLQYVSRPPNKALAQSTPIRKEAVPQRHEREMYSRRTVSQSETHKSTKMESTREKTGTKVKTDNVKLPVIVEKWEEEMCEIKEMSSAMSVRLRKNIYDRMKTEHNKFESKDDGEKVQVVQGNISQESWELNIPDDHSPQASVKPKSLSQAPHVRRLFEEGHGSRQQTEENQWGGSEKVDSFQKPELARQPLLLKSTDRDMNSDNQDDWWDAPVMEEKSQKVPVIKRCDEQGFDNAITANKTVIKAPNTNAPVMVDSWEELEVAEPGISKSRSDSDSRATSFTSSSGSLEEINFQRSVSPSLYSWGMKSKEGSPDAITGNHKTNETHDESKPEGLVQKDETSSALHHTAQNQGNIDAKDELSEGEPRKDNVTPKKGSCIISGRIKNLLKTYIESNKENIHAAGDYSRTTKSDDGALSECATENLSNVTESYKSKLMKDTTYTEKPDKPKATEETTFTTLGTVPSKSKPPDKAQLRKTTSMDDDFDIKPHKSQTSQHQMPKSLSPVKVKIEEIQLPCTVGEEKVSDAIPKSSDITDVFASKKSTIPVVTAFQIKSERESESSMSGGVRRVQRVYTDLSQLVFSGNSWSELSGTLVNKIGHLRKGEGDGFFFPIGVSLTSQGHIVVADNGNNLVKIIKDGIVKRNLGVDDLTLNHPSAVVVNERDEIYVKDNSGIFKFDLNGNLLFQFGQKMLKRPYGLALTYNGYLVTLDVTRTNHLLYLFHQDGTVFRSNIFGPLMNNMQQSKCRFLEVFREKVLVSDLGLSVMYLGNLFGQVFRCFGYLGSAPGMLREPSGVTVDSAGNWVIADSKNDRIQVFSPNGQYLFPIKLSEPIYRPSDIMLTPDRHLLVVNYLTHSVKVYKLG